MKTEIEKFLEDKENRRIFERESLVIEITEAICAILNEKGLTRAQFAQRLGCSPSNVSQLLDGEQNLTVHTIADWLFALDSRLLVSTEPLLAAGSTKQQEVRTIYGTCLNTQQVRYDVHGAIPRDQIRPPMMAA
ncbi:MAG: helix-turn-helix transcriptional regulator [Phycisphaerales bacterium]|nr:helix-turn-helix transcriptional regulator [Phycisphaerales bacterium]